MSIEPHQVRACQKLLAAVVAHAVKDACLPLVRRKVPSATATSVSVRGKHYEITLDPDAESAILFLFGDGGGLESYLGLLDIDPQSFRERLRSGEVFGRVAFLGATPRATQNFNRNLRLAMSPATHPKLRVVR